MNRVMAILAIGMLTATLSISTVTAEPFEWIMESIAKAGTLDNGQGHYWTFRKTSDGKWKFDTPSGNIGKVVSTSENKVEIDSLPYGWNANGGYDFSREGGKCKLESDHSTHQLKWNC